MSLFISNFRSELKALLFVALVFAAGEIFLRISLERLSIDARQQRTFSAIAASVRTSSSGTVLFLGNSLTREGVDLDTALSSLRAAGYRDVAAFKVTPDDTTVLDWYYTFKRYFLETQSKPKVLVIGFAGDHLADTAPFHAERIARYAGLKYAGEIFSNDLTQLGDRVNYVLSATSECFAEGNRLRLAALDALIPGYRSTAQLVNASAKKHAAKAAQPKSFHRLERLLATCQASGVEPVIVAMPEPDTYFVDPQIPALVRQYQGAFLDLRHVNGLARTYFSDGFHMDSRGAAIYTRELSKALGTYLRAGKTAPVISSSMAATGGL